MSNQGMSGYLQELAKEITCDKESPGTLNLENNTWCQMQAAKKAGEITEELAVEASKGKGHVGVFQLETRARSLCKALDIWMRSLRTTPEGTTLWIEGRCTPERTGWLGKPWDPQACPYDRNLDLWSIYNAGVKLYWNQPHQKALALCIRVMSLILDMLNNVSRTGTDWVHIPGTRNICQAIYDQLKKELGREASGKFMKDWFLNEGSDKKYTGLPRISKVNEGGSWGEFLKPLGVSVVGLQCTQDPDGQDRYQTTCIYRRNESSCEVDTDLTEATWQQEKKAAREEMAQEQTAFLALVQDTQNRVSGIRPTKPNGGYLEGVGTGIVLLLGALGGYGLWRILKSKVRDGPTLIQEVPKKLRRRVGLSYLTGPLKSQKEADDLT
ncbi:hypothetical protein C922_05139 [Plasmodium inui San Antonio 1]|uniref:Uncharacterized protein n=1 Tax=Plasmodium inui San Antonio 1 TaxID=1237626 RepID=W7AGQ7_9APIC|nr:hypothetical protein C922_05139 [Plasmodium inui San Antonio 1]EUD64476.1 hypothetical protein C922_05139 [Plasmodium inui San Antonio 1]